MAGFEEAVRETGDARLAALVLPSGTSFEGGRLGLGELLQRAPRPRAIFFSNDVLAVGALMECKRRGLRVPEDIAIAGFVDLDIAQAVEPGLTTVHVGSRQIGEEAARLLLARLDGETVTDPVRDLGFRVVARASA
jgi:LacI family gluconate utilization system Gnt-I transcriptional repressor